MVYNRVNTLAICEWNELGLLTNYRPGADGSISKGYLIPPEPSADISEWKRRIERYLPAVVVRVISLKTLSQDTS